VVVAIRGQRGSGERQGLAEAGQFQQLRRSGYVIRDSDKLVELWAVGVGPRDLGTAPPAPPRPPKPPKVPPPGWDPVNDPDDDGGG